MHFHRILRVSENSVSTFKLYSHILYFQFSGDASKNVLYRDGKFLTRTQTLINGKVSRTDFLHSQRERGLENKTVTFETTFFVEVQYNRHTKSKLGEWPVAEGWSFVVCHARRSNFRAEYTTLYILISQLHYSNTNLRRHPLRLTFFSWLADKDYLNDQNFAPHRSVILHLQLIWIQEHGPKSPRQLSINTSKDADAVSSFCLQHRQCMFNPCPYTLTFSFQM